MSKEAVHVKQEPQCEGSGVRYSLHADHTVKDELAGDPIVLHPPDAGSTANVSSDESVTDGSEQKLVPERALGFSQLSLRDCFVRLERSAVLEAPLDSDMCGARFATQTAETSELAQEISSSKVGIARAYECAIYKKQFALKPDLRKHIHTAASTDSVHTREKECSREEPVRVKEEPSWENSAELCGVSEAAASAGLYAGHEVKDELVLGPECLQPRDVAYALRKESRHSARRALRDCFVLLERCGRRPPPPRPPPPRPPPHRPSPHRGRYECDACGRTYRHKWNLARHVRLHVPGETATSHKRDRTVPGRERSQTMFACDTCDTRYTTRSGLFLHKKPYPRLKPLTCAICDLRFERICDFYIHRRTHTLTGERPYSCGTCPKAFKRLAHLKLHKLICSVGIKSYSCDICDIKFTAWGRLRNHERKHEEAASAIQSYSCEICNKQFTKRSYLKNHKSIHTGEKPYSCDVCKKKFRDFGHLKGHKRIHTGEKPYSCDVCKKEFRVLDQFRSHKRIHTGERPYSCDVCGKTFKQSSHLKGHLLIHSEVKSYSCDVCKKKFKRASEVKTHARIHTGEKPYSCEICKKQFTTASHLGSHKRVHTGVKAYSCDICKRKFAYSHGLNMHKHTHTGKMPYSCEICTKKFSQFRYLQSHNRTHTGLKPYCCKVCKKQFAHSVALTVHMRIHKGLKPYSCELCKKKFRQSGNLKKHVCSHEKPPRKNKKASRR